MSVKVLDNQELSARLLKLEKRVEKLERSGAGPDPSHLHMTPMVPAMERGKGIKTKE